MAITNSTVLSNDAKSADDYSDYSLQTSYEVNQLRARIAGARSLVYESESDFNSFPHLLDAAYILDEVYREMESLACKISNTEFTYQFRTDGANS